MRTTMTLGSVFLLSGCALFSPIPDARQPSDRAHELDVACRGLSEATAASVLSSASIDSVESFLTHVQSGNGYETRLVGAKLHFKPLPGLTQESLQRELQCHQARVVLKVAAGLPDDPFVDANRWLDIHVSSDGNGFLAEVQSFDFDSARAALARAKRFTGAR